VEWSEKLRQGRLLKRYKRFLADVELDSGEQLTVHCPNTGAMTGCAEPGSRVWLSHSDNPKRKYAYTWQLVENSAGAMICIHSALANGLVAERLQNSGIAELAGYKEWQREVKLVSGSRIDFFHPLSKNLPDCYMEVKSVTLDCGDGLGAFPDAVSQRAAKHLRELIELRQQGARAVLLFAVLHEGIDRVKAAEHIDPRYAQSLREALAAGVEVIALKADFTPSGLALGKPLSIIC
jgi:sugar fermentation stimulation protein A